MYKISNDLQFKPQEKSINFLNPEEKRNKQNNEIKNKYNNLYQPLNYLQKK